jgi:hypothetical protein
MSFQKLLAFFASDLLLDLGSPPVVFRQRRSPRALGAALSIKMRTRRWRD